MHAFFLHSSWVYATCYRAWGSCGSSVFSDSEIQLGGDNCPQLQPCNLNPQSNLCLESHLAVMSLARQKCEAHVH